MAGDLIISSGSYTPLAKNADWSSSMRYFSVTTVNPITTTTGESRYLLSPNTGVNISNFYHLESLTYNPSLNQLQWTLSAPKTQGAITRTNFPSAGGVFDKWIIKKGTEVRLNKDYDDLTVTTNDDSTKVYAVYTYNLTSQDTFD